MKNAVLCVPMVVGSVCFGGITQIIDERGVNLGLVQDRVDYFINETVKLNSSDYTQAFDGVLESSASDPGAGYVESFIEYESSLSLTGFRSSSFASGFTESSGYMNFMSTGFSNQVVFSLDSTTSFSIVADLWTMGESGGAMIRFMQIYTMDVVYEVRVMNSTRHIDEVLTLEAGLYSFSAINWASVISFEDGDVDSSQASLVIDVNVIPGPSALICLGAGLLGVGRRR